MRGDCGPLAELGLRTRGAPVVSRVYPLRDIARAQEDFLAKKHVGKLVLRP